MSTAFTGLLEGFTQTKLTLDERDRQREKDQADADPGPITQTPLQPTTSLFPSAPWRPNEDGQGPRWSTVQPSPEILTAVQRESQATGVPPHHLLGLGAVESAMDPAATGPM